MIQDSASGSSRWTNYLSRFSPIPSFPEYTGPYQVGTVDVEVPITQLDSPAPAPENAEGIPTVLFRIYYPAEDDSSQPRINWLPNPQRHHVAAYTKFLGAGARLADILAYLPRNLYWTTIPAHKNATLKKPVTDNQQWPTMIFSHGLGGSRNSYSYIGGSLASHGVVVVCPEHRDGSAIASHVRIPDKNSKTGWRGSRPVDYVKISHEVNDKTYEAREAQIRIRCWELSLVHDAVLRMQRGSEFLNLNQSTASLSQFAGKLHVEQPNSVIFAGHSFGASTTVHFVKSVFYAQEPAVAAMEKPIFRPREGSEIRRQITEKTLIMLLDMWCLPLMGPNTKASFELPLPAYADTPSAPGGSAILAVESEHFFKWTEHLDAKARVLSADPKAETVQASSFVQPSGMNHAQPNFFYVVNSAHLNQSDFGILFPSLTKRIFKAEQPERALRLNLRAQLQALRVNGYQVARTYAGDLVEGSDSDKVNQASDSESASDNLGIHDDPAIFRHDEVVSYWKWIDIVGLGNAASKPESGTSGAELAKGEKELEGEIEPAEVPPAALKGTLSAAA